MAQKRLGIVVSAPDSSAVLTSIANLEQRGIPAAWLTSAGAGGADPLGALAGAALRTQHILLGTAITQTFPRHPIAVVQQVQVLAQLAPGRFRLGLGTSGRAGMEQAYGVNFRDPLGHLREYLRIVKALLHTGSVDFAGRYYQAHTRISTPVDVPVMAAALGEKAYELCGAEADGAISWVCPGAYLRDVALPALHRGADRPVARCHRWSPMRRCASMTTPRRCGGGPTAVRRLRAHTLLPEHVPRRGVRGSNARELERCDDRRRRPVGRRSAGGRGHRRVVRPGSDRGAGVACARRR